MEQPNSHFRSIQHVLWIVLILNWAVAGAKIAWGLLSHTASMTADGFHSLADGTSNIIGLIGIHFASRPKDEDHPYGHKKYETLFALGIAAMLLIVAFNLARGGIARLITPILPEVSMASFAVMLLTLAVNATVMLYEYRRGKKLGSDILIVDSMHTRADLLTSVSVIAALVAIRLGWPIADPLITIAIAGFIAWSAWEIIREESGILLDAAVMLDTTPVENVVRAIPGVMDCHGIRTRGRADDVYLDIHVQVDPDMKLSNSHRLSHVIAAELKKSLPQITDVLVHLEPYGR